MERTEDFVLKRALIMKVVSCVSVIVLAVTYLIYMSEMSRYYLYSDTFERNLSRILPFASNASKQNFRHATVTYTFHLELFSVKSSTDLRKFSSSNVPMAACRLLQICII